MDLVVIRTSPRLFLILLVALWPWSGTHLGGQVRESARGGASLPDSAGSVMGQVVDVESGRPLYGAAVSLTSGPEGTRGMGTRVTGDDGAFLFRAVPPGLYRVTVTLLGYHDLRDTLRVELERELRVVLPLSVSPVELRPIVVESRQTRRGFLAGFESRRQRLGGTFFDREEIERRAPFQFTDLMRLVPGARVVPVSAYRNRIQLRGRCIPSLWVDGTRTMSTPDLDTLLRPEDLEAVEVYSGGQLPARFGPSACGAIVVWTRPGEAQSSPNSLRLQLIIAAGFAALALLLSSIF